MADTSAAAGIATVPGRATGTVATELGPSSVAIGGDRGRLDISQRAVERIAEITARRHGGVARRDAVLGRGLPKARAVIAGRRTRIEVEVAAAWGRPLDDVAAEVRQAVADDVERFTGFGVDRVDVDITAVDPRTRTAEGTEGTEVTEGTEGTEGIEGAEPLDVVAPPAAKAPVAGPAAAVLGVLGALLLICVGAAGIAEMFRATGLLRGQVIPASWFGRMVQVGPADWLRPAGIAAVVAGVLLLFLALKPRRRTHLCVQPDDSLVWIRSADVARLAADSAGQVDSVTSATVVAKRRRLHATVTTFGDAVRVSDEVSTAIADRLGTVVPLPRVRVHLKED